MSLAFENGPDWVDQNGVRLGSYRDWVDSLVAPASGFKRGTPRKKPHAVAYVNHGRWVIDCPLGDGGARLGNPDYDFFCVECGNTFTVEWPDAKTIEAISADLSTVPERSAQNFDPRVK